MAISKFKFKVNIYEINCKILNERKNGNLLKYISMYVRKKHIFYLVKIYFCKPTDRIIKFLKIDIPILNYLRSASFMVPVPFNLKVLVAGLAAPFGSPKVAALALQVWDPLGAITCPERLETPGFEVFLRPNELPVGAN